MYFLIVTETDRSYLFIAEDKKDLMAQWNDLYGGYEGHSDFVIYTIREIPEGEVESLVARLQIEMPEK